MLPFTRYLCGPADYTICWYDKRLKPTGAHQLALAVVYFSPWQFVFWYDRPSIVGDEPELAFFKHVPTVWDDTRVLDGKIGQYITLARRSGKQWFVGTIGATTRRQLKIPLAFLDADTKYTAEVYADGRSHRRPAAGEDRSDNRRLPHAVGCRCGARRRPGDSAGSVRQVGDYLPGTGLTIPSNGLASLSGCGIHTRNSESGPQVRPAEA